MVFRMKRFAAVSSLLILPATAQFGVGANKRQGGTNFQDLQEMAKQKQAAGGGADADDGGMAAMMEDAMNDPEYMKKLGEMGDQFGGALQQMMKMSPEELQQQMEQAMKLMTDTDVVENILNQKDEVIKSLEASGTVSAEEIERYKADPNYFELKMRESFDQMGELFQNPDYIKQATEAMQGMKNMAEDPKLLNDMMKMMSAEWQDDEKIEEARLQLLSGEFESIPGFQEAFETEEMKEILKDPVKWKETVKEGFRTIVGGEAVKDEL